MPSSDAPAGAPTWPGTRNFQSRTCGIEKYDCRVQRPKRPDLVAPGPWHKMASCDSCSVAHKMVSCGSWLIQGVSALNLDKRKRTLWPLPFLLLVLASFTQR